jgi:hypothetical protein
MHVAVAIKRIHRVELEISTAKLNREGTGPEEPLARGWECMAGLLETKNVYQEIPAAK